MQISTYVFGGLLTTLAPFLSIVKGKASNYIWPLSGSTTPDEMNTSFGPRINHDKRDFHDGIDLPAPRGTRIYAMRKGIVHNAGDKDQDLKPYSSRHVVLEVNDPHDGLMYLVYFHLDKIAPGIVAGAMVGQGTPIGKVGDDGADPGYTHLHIEFRKGANKEINSVHPLGYLPYNGTKNFTPPVADRFNRIGGLMAARLLFDGNSRLEGDLRCVEVDLKSGSTLHKTRVVDFNRKTTVNEGIGDELVYKGDIGVEGYQTSNMSEHGQLVLKYGILLRNLPANCNKLAARVVDVGGNVVVNNQISVPDEPSADSSVDFNDNKMPPTWHVIPSQGAAVNDASAGRNGSPGMLCPDSSQAAIEYHLPPRRFEWSVEGWFNPTSSSLNALNRYVYLLHFLNGANFSVAAQIRHDGTQLVAGIAYKTLNNTLKNVEDSKAVINTGVWRRWRLSLLRIATRETTAVLYLDDGAQLVERVRVSWDSTHSEPHSVRAGVAQTSSGVTVAMMADDIKVTESAL